MRPQDSASHANRRAIGEDRVEPQSGVHPGRTPLDGHYAALEPLDPRRHGDAIAKAIRPTAPGAETMWRFMPYGPFSDATAIMGWLRGCAATADPAFCVCRDKKGGEFTGMASFMSIRPADGVAEIGHIWFAPPFQRTRSATEALYLMMRHVMETLGYRRIEWKCNALNERSRNAALRLGFRYEGEFLNHIVVKGLNRDTAWYSIINTEWPAVRDNFERWLAPSNFDDLGRQKSSLGASNRLLW